MALPDVALPDPVQLKRQAKELLRAVRAGDREAVERVSDNLPKMAKRDPGKDDYALVLTEAQLVIARENSYSSWPKLLQQALHGSAQERQKILSRLSDLVSDRRDDVLRSLEILGPQKTGSILSLLGGDLLEDLPGEWAEPAEGASEAEIVGALEELERLTMARKYVADGGIQFARGALAKALGMKQADALLAPLELETLVARVKTLLDEDREAGRKVLQLMQSDPERVAIAAEVLGDDVIREHVDGRTLPSLDGEASVACRIEVLEELEQLLVTLEYLKEGHEYARGALEKAVGTRKARVLLERVSGAAS